MQESYRQIIQNKKKNRLGYNKTTIKSSEMQRKVDQNMGKSQLSHQNHKKDQTALQANQFPPIVWAHTASPPPQNNQGLHQSSKKAQGCLRGRATSPRS